MKIQFKTYRRVREKKKRVEKKITQMEKEKEGKKIKIFEQDFCFLWVCQGFVKN